jgi:hypothetical protein
MPSVLIVVTVAITTTKVAVVDIVHSLMWQFKAVGQLALFQKVPFGISPIPPFKRFKPKPQSKSQSKSQPISQPKALEIGMGVGMLLDIIFGTHQAIAVENAFSLHRIFKVPALLTHR